MLLFRMDPKPDKAVPRFFKTILYAMAFCNIKKCGGRRECKCIHPDGNGGFASDLLTSRYVSHLTVNLRAKTEGLSAVGD